MFLRRNVVAGVAGYSAPLILLFILLSRSLSIYVSALWFGSVGYSTVYWYILKIKVALFLIFFILTAVILRAGFLLLERIFAAHASKPRTIIVNNQPVQFSPARYLDLWPGELL